jgi:hypothetical protein
MTDLTERPATGLVPVEDTALAFTDTGGPGVPVLYLNGQFATQGYWRRVVAELGRLSRESELGPVLDSITVPVRYVVASGTSFGSHGDEQERIRAGLDAAVARNPHIRIGARVTSNHGALLRKDFRAIAATLRGLA